MVSILKIGAALFGLLAVLTVLYAVKLLLTEDLYTSRKTFAYYVTIQSSNIKNFPLIGVVGDEVYYSSCGDGPKPPANGIRYNSTEDPQTLRTSIEQYLLDRGFIKEEQSIEGGSYVQPGSKTSLELDIRPENEGLHRVIATEYYIFD